MTTSGSLALAALLSSAFLLNASIASAQTASPPATATRPATTPPGQSSLPGDTTPASRTDTTGEASRDPVVKKMNEDEKHKVETKGK